jgi:guanylate kinase
LDAINAVQDQGRICILDVDIKGVKAVRQASLPANYLFITPPSVEVLSQRLLKRGTETAEQIKMRLSNAAAEIEYGSAAGSFDEVVVNDDLDYALAQIGKLLCWWYPSLIGK